MRPAIVRLVDFGLDDAFAASMNFAQATMQSINAGLDHPAATVEYVRTADQRTVISALLAPALVVHVTAHGIASRAVLTASDERTELNLRDLRAAAVQRGGLQAKAILVDGCSTDAKAWKKAFADALGADAVIYIGARGEVGWLEATVFSSMFYSVLFRNKGRGVEPYDRVKTAADGAVIGYSSLLGRACPYRVTSLEPSGTACDTTSV